MVPETIRAEVVVVGSGPGGATVARQLARAGRQVLLLERGQDYRNQPYYGTYLGALIYTDRHALLFTNQGQNIIRPLMVGGATSMYCGCSARPPAWWKERYGVDLDDYVEQTLDELAIAPLPPELRGTVSTRLAEAAGDLGYDWVPQDKFMSPARTGHFDCGAKCMLGCRCGAKWNAGEYVADAVRAGAVLLTGAQVDRVQIHGSQAVGVRGRRGRNPFEVQAQTVVVAAGGIGTPLLLQKSGIAGAGQGMTMDTTVMVYGRSKYVCQGHEPPMTWSWEDLEHGYMLSTLIDPWLMYPIMMTLKGLQYALTWSQWQRTMGVMIKLKDDITGQITLDEKIDKPMSDKDRERLAQAEVLSRRILLKAGAEPDSLVMTPLRGTHPSGTVRMGEVLDTNLQTQVRGLYVCDASVFPEALARPTVLTIIALGKRLADHLLRATDESRNAARPAGALSTPAAG